MKALDGQNVLRVLTRWWDTPAVSCGKSCVCLVLCWALAPFLCCFAVAFCGETQIWLGDLRVVCRFSPVSLSGDMLICLRIVWMEPLRFMLSF